MESLGSTSHKGLQNMLLEQEIKLGKYDFSEAIRYIFKENVRWLIDIK